jgi:hypothetical protein
MKRITNIFQGLIKHLFKFIIVLLFIGFSFKDVTSPIINSWYKQTIPSLSDSIIYDIHFIDTLTGFLTTSKYLLKTTNSGDNWFLNYDIGTGNFFIKTYFLNKDSGIALTAFSLGRTTNRGDNWTFIHFPGLDMSADNMYVSNWDSIWTVGDDGVHGQIYFSTNGGQNWNVKHEIAHRPIDYIYFYNKRIGYASPSMFQETYKTTNGGDSWFFYLNEPIYNMYFSDSLTGWRCCVSIKKTTDGGANWFQQQLPYTNWYTGMLKFSALNKDTIWGVGGIKQFYPAPGGYNAVIYKTINGGLNWGYQIPDTTIKFSRYQFCQFVDSKHGWCYSNLMGGVHTKIGGSDTTFFTGIKKIETTNSPTKFILFQNYPNPFNPLTNIKYQITNNSFVTLKVYSLLGKETNTLVNQKQSAGIYVVDYSGENLSSGVYLYALFADGIRIDTKKLVLLK